MADFVWTEERKKEARSLWDLNKTKRQIAEHFGITTPCIIGVRQREKWPERDCDYSRKKKTEEEKEAFRKSKPKKEKKKTIKMQSKQTVFEVIDMKLVKMINIKEGQCREIIGVPSNMIMCGNPVFCGSYCKNHYNKNVLKTVRVK